MSHTKGSARSQLRVPRLLAAALALAAQYAGAQTRVDLRTQSKSVDFSAASSSKSFQTGTTLSSSCSQGQTFFKINAAPGANFYGCTSLDTWTPQFGNPPGGVNTQIQYNNAGALGGASGLTWNGSAFSLVSSLTAGVASTVDLTAAASVRLLSPIFTAIVAPSSPASGQGRCYIDSTTKAWTCKDDAAFLTQTWAPGAGIIASGNALAFDTSFGNTNYARVNAASVYGPFLQDFTLGSMWTPSAPGAAPTASQSLAYNSTSHRYVAGENGISVTLLDSGHTVAIASGAKSLAISAIGSSTCSSAQTDTATGAATTDTIIWSFNNDPTGVTGYVPLTSGMLRIVAYPTANTVNFKICNETSGSITPGAITLNWRVIR